MTPIRLCAVASLAAACVVTTLAAQSAQAQTYKEKVLYSVGFCDGPNGPGCPDGSQVNTGVIRDAQGNLYGTMFEGGGIFNYDTYCCGVVFKLDTTGHETVLYAFCQSGGGYCTDGSSPSAGLIEDAQGNLYGTTEEGGENNCESGVGCGVVFKLDTTGHETVLYAFCPGGENCTDGFWPTAGLIEDAQGNLYGTTSSGGSQVGNCVKTAGCGVVFKVDTAGQETVLYTFCSQEGCADGANPVGNLTRDIQGNLYGTTEHGGASNDSCAGGTCGVVFKLGTSGNETVLYTFCPGERSSARMEGRPAAV